MGESGRTVVVQPGAIQVSFTLEAGAAEDEEELVRRVKGPVMRAIGEALDRQLGLGVGAVAFEAGL